MGITMRKNIIQGKLSDNAYDLIMTYIKEHKVNQREALEHFILESNGHTSPLVDSPLIDDDLLDQIKECIAEYSPDSSLKKYIEAMLIAQLPSTKEEFKASIQKAEPEHKCPYRADIGKGQVECGRLLSKKGRVIKMSVQACNACQLRRAYIQQKNGTPKEPSNKIYCAIENRYIPVSKEVLELPCIKNIDYICPNTKCHDDILTLIKG